MSGGEPTAASLGAAASGGGKAAAAHGAAAALKRDLPRSPPVPAVLLDREAPAVDYAPPPQSPAPSQAQAEAAPTAEAAAAARAAKLARKHARLKSTGDIDAVWLNKGELARLRTWWEAQPPPRHDAATVAALADLGACTTLQCVSAAGARLQGRTRFNIPHFFIIGWQKTVGARRASDWSVQRRRCRRPLARASPCQRLRAVQGTTSVHAYLRHHPQLLFGRAKETHWFASCQKPSAGPSCKADNETHYLREALRVREAAAKGLEAATVDASADYARVRRAARALPGSRSRPALPCPARPGPGRPLLTWTPPRAPPQLGVTLAPRLRELFPWLKIVIMLRDPISRAISYTRMHTGERRAAAAPAPRAAPPLLPSPYLPQGAHSTSPMIFSEQKHATKGCAPDESLYDCLLGVLGEFLRQTPTRCCCCSHPQRRATNTHPPPCRPRPPAAGLWQATYSLAGRLPQGPGARHPDGGDAGGSAGGGGPVEGVPRF
jgi:hypothetical protein